MLPECPDKFEANLTRKRELVLRTIGPTPNLERIARLLATAPPLTDGQKATISALLRVPAPL